MFEVKDQATEKVHVIKDCWVEDRPGKLPEHEIVARIKSKMDDDKFGQHFVNICGHHKMHPSGGFDRVCKILQTRKFILNVFEPELLIPAPSTQKATYSTQATHSIADQDHFLQPTPKKEVPANPPHPRFRYQVVYEESGKSLFEVTLLSDALAYIHQAAEGS